MKIKHTSASSRSSGLFNRLLTEANNEIRHDDDSKFAKMTQLEESNALAARWRQEERDRLVATEISERLSAESKLQIEHDIKNGEKEALRVAIEERRRIQNAEREKLLREQRDAEYAKQIISEEIEGEKMFKQACEEDPIIAVKVQDILRDEVLAEEIALKEEQMEFQIQQYQRQLEEKDQEIARELQSILDQESAIIRKKQTEEDFECARREQVAWETSNEVDKIKIQNDDEKASIKIAIQTMRENHRHRKKLLHQASEKALVIDEEQIAEQWLNAEADVEDVANGICITLFLPNLLDLKVKCVSKTKIEIDASRSVSHKNKSSATAENSTYSAEFLIEGPKVRITNEALSWIYESETGLLHVYIDAVHLDSGNTKEDMEASNKVLKTLSNGFSRIFGKQSK